MASIEDRWLRDGPDGEKVPTERNGVGFRWRARYRTPAGKQRSKSFARKADAERFLTSVESSKLTGTFVDPARAKLTVRALSEGWLKSKASLKANTRANYTSVLDTHVLPHWGDVSLAAIDYESIQAWVGELAEAGLSGALIEKIHVVLSSMLDTAVRNRRIPANPARGIELPDSTPGPRRYLTVAQVEKLAKIAGVYPADQPKRIGHTGYDQYRVFVLLLAYCGPRWSEASAVRVQSLDLVKRRVWINEAVTEVRGALEWGLPKNGKRRWVPLPDFLISDLEKLTVGKAPEDLLFTSPEGGVLRRPNAVRAWFTRAATLAGLSGLVPHELRHTAASLAVSAGANVVAVSRMLGHANAAITLKVYADLFDEDLDRVAIDLDRLRTDSGVSPAIPETPAATAEETA